MFMTHPGVLHLFLGDGVVLRHLCFIFRSVLASPCTNSAPLRMYGVTEIASSRRMGHGSLYPCIPLHILRSAVYVRGYGDSVFQTHGAMGSLYPCIPPAHTPLRCVCTGLQRWRLPDAWGMGLSIIASPRTYSAPLCMYGVTEMAPSRRMGLLDSISKFFIPHSSFIIFNFNSLCPVKNQYICKNKLNVKR